MSENIACLVGQALLQQHYKLATAESCTGGCLAAELTAIAGSSQWFDRGFVTYSNTAKVEMLGICEQTLANEGAVSERIAQQMAAGAMRYSQAQVAIATTGIAGPSGGTISKPVGMVCFAWGFAIGDIMTTTHFFSGDRHAVRKQAVVFALQALLQLLDK